MEKARPRVSDVYRNNMEYKTLDQTQQEQIQAIVNSLKKSKVVKVCKDQYTIKRRIPFKMTSQIKETIDNCTIFVQSDVDLTKYRPRDVRKRQGYI